jgi:hypothetical protein
MIEALLLYCWKKGKDGDLTPRATKHKEEAADLTQGPTPKLTAKFGSMYRSPASALEIILSK